ncbi:MAG: hypothetical protein H0T62_07480 [Parachlamydiaceae bacterium]|nr:hypothetical protein [Parachlamydiaceae bacterium]
MIGVFLKLQLASHREFQNDTKDPKEYQKLDSDIGEDQSQSISEAQGRAVDQKSGKVVEDVGNEEEDKIPELGDWVPGQFAWGISSENDSQVKEKNNERILIVDGNKVIIKDPELKIFQSPAPLDVSNHMAMPSNNEAIQKQREEDTNEF